MTDKDEEQYRKAGRPVGLKLAAFRKNEKAIVKDLSAGMSFRAAMKKYNVSKSLLSRYINANPRIKRIRAYLQGSGDNIKALEVVQEKIKEKSAELELQLQRPPNAVELRLVVDPTVEVTEEDLQDVPILSQVSLRAALANQQLANQLLYAEKGELSRADLKMHSDITKINASVIAGEQENLIQIQINAREKDLAGNTVKALPLPQEIYDVEIIEVEDEDE